MICEGVALLDTICNRIAKNYIFSDVASKISSLLQTNKKNEKYNQISSPSQFAQSVTQDLRSVNNDRHLLVWYNGLVNSQTSNSQTLNQVDTTHGIDRVEILPGNVGYLKFNYFPSDQDQEARRRYDDVFRKFKSVDAIIVDLTDNYGGNPRMEVYLCSYFFSDFPRHLWDAYDRSRDSTYNFWTLQKLDAPRLVEIPVYVLTSSSTFSAGEAFAYDLKAQQRAKIVGETTAGGAHPTGVFDLGHGFMMRIPITKITNAVTKEDWEGIGVIPDVSCFRDEAYSLAYIQSLKDVNVNTIDGAKRKMTSRILEKLIADEESFLRANEYLREYEGELFGWRKKNRLQ